MNPLNANLKIGWKQHDDFVLDYWKKTKRNFYTQKETIRWVRYC